jgi:hypothetical protein
MFNDYVLKSAAVSGTAADISCPPDTYIAGGATACSDASGSRPPLQSETDANNGWRGACPGADNGKVTTEISAVCVTATDPAAHHAP